MQSASVSIGVSLTALDFLRQPIAAGGAREAQRIRRARSHAGDRRSPPSLCTKAISAGWAFPTLGRQVEERGGMDQVSKSCGIIRGKRVGIDCGRQSHTGEAARPFKLNVRRAIVSSRRQAAACGYQQDRQNQERPVQIAQPCLSAPVKLQTDLTVMPTPFHPAWTAFCSRLPFPYSSPPTRYIRLAAC